MFGLGTLLTSWLVERFGRHPGSLLGHHVQNREGSATVYMHMKAKRSVACGSAVAKPPPPRALGRMRLFYAANSCDKDICMLYIHSLPGTSPW